jgi:hypothetical protein
MSIYVMPESETPDELPEPPADSLVCRISVTPVEDPIQEIDIEQ